MPILTLTSKEVFSKKVCFDFFFFLRLPKRTNDRIMYIQCISFPSCRILERLFSVCIWHIYVIIVPYFINWPSQCLIIFKTFMSDSVK